MKLQETTPGDLAVLDPFGPIFYDFIPYLTLMDHIGPYWTILDHCGQFFLLFRPVFLDPSIETRLFGPVY